MENVNGASERKTTLDRRVRILELLEQKGQVYVNDLTKLLEVSEVTIRNDLDKLEEKGLLIRTHGGGIQTQKVRIDYQFNKELTFSFKEKQTIGREAAKLVKEKDTVILDSGTTTLEVARNLVEFNDLTIITNGIKIAYELANYPNLKVFMLGGSIKQSSLAVSGPFAEQNLKNLYCDKVFLGVNGIDSRHGLFTTHIEDAYLNRLMISMSNEVIVVTDSTKFQKRSFSIISALNEVDTLVTDSNVPKEELTAIQNMGVKTIVVDSNQ